MTAIPAADYPIVSSTPDGWEVWTDPADPDSDLSVLASLLPEGRAHRYAVSYDRKNDCHFFIRLYGK